MYRINDELVIPFSEGWGVFYLWTLSNKSVFLQEYSVEIYEWSGTSWEPYVASDVQLQFYMMSPYVLKTMSTDRKVVSEKDVYVT